MRIFNRQPATLEEMTNSKWQMAEEAQRETAVNRCADTQAQCEARGGDEAREAQSLNLGSPDFGSGGTGVTLTPGSFGSPETVGDDPDRISRTPSSSPFGAPGRPTTPEAPQETPREGPAAKAVDWGHPYGGSGESGADRAASEFAQAPGEAERESKGSHSRGEPVVSLGNAHAGVCAVGSVENLKPEVQSPAPLRRSNITKQAQWRRLAEGWAALQAKGFSREAAAEALGTSAVTLWRLDNHYEKRGFAAKIHLSGRKPKVLPTAGELDCVRAVYMKLDESQVRGRGRGSSKVTAFRLAAKSDDPRISDVFRSVILKRRRKGLPPSWERLLDAPASVLDKARDKRSTMAAYVSTPRGRTWVNEAGEELPMRAGTIFESDDGTQNFYATVPWPFGGDKCSDKFGVKLGRWQLLPAVDARWGFCCAFDIVARNLGSYRGEDAGALLGRTMAEVCVPELWRLERGSWESAFVRDALDLCQVPYVNAWHSKQKAAVEGFFDRLWTPASLIPGHCGRDRGRFKEVQDLALACQDGRRDPREHFLSLEACVPRVIGAIEFVNGEPVESKGWGSWVPQERFEAQLGEDQAQGRRTKLDPALRIFFSREQRTWTVRGCCVGGPVEGPLVKFPMYFQCPELWEFEGCKVKAYFEPYAEPVLGTLVLQEEWRGLKPGHVVARDVPALELPPQVVRAADGWAGEEEGKKSLAIRKAISKAVRTECWSWQGQRASEARDGLGNVARVDGGADCKLRIENCKSQIAKTRPAGLQQVLGGQIKGPTAEQAEGQRNRLSRAAAAARRLSGLVRPE